MSFYEKNTNKEKSINLSDKYVTIEDWIMDDTNSEEIINKILKEFNIK